MRPPIIISNGGVIGLLAEGCANLKTEDDVADQIKDNIVKLNVKEKNGYKTKVVVIKKAGENTPCLYWRLSSDQDTPFPGHGKEEEGVSINDIIDNTI